MHRSIIGLAALAWVGCSGGSSGPGLAVACEVSSYCVTVTAAVCAERSGDTNNAGATCSDLGYTCEDGDRRYRDDDPVCADASSPNPQQGSCIVTAANGERCTPSSESDCSGTFESGSCDELSYPWECGEDHYAEGTACNEECTSSCSYLGDETDLEPGACRDETSLGADVCEEGEATGCSGTFVEGATCEEEGYTWTCDSAEGHYLGEFDCIIECLNGTCSQDGAPPDAGVDPDPIDPEDGLPTGGGVIAVSITGKTTTTLDFEIDVFVIDGDGDVIPDLEEGDLYFEDDIFDYPGEEDPFFTFTQTCFTPMTTPESGPYSAIMLMDQSGSISGTDPGDTRVDAAKVFFNALGPNDEAILAAFASSGSLGNDFVSWGEFGVPADYDAILDTLPNLENGGTPLFDATVVYTDKVALEGNNDNKAVIVFTDGADTESTNSLTSAAENANTQGVRLFTVGLSSGVDRGVLQQLAFQTGGSMMYTDDATDLIALYGTLGNLLSGGVSYYHTCWTVERDLQDFESGYFNTSVAVTRADGGTAYVPIHIEY